MPIKIVFVCLLDQGHLQIPVAIGKTLLFRDPQNQIYFVCDDENHKRLKGKCSQFQTLIFDVPKKEQSEEKRKKKLDIWMMKDNKERYKNHLINYGNTIIDLWKEKSEIIQNLINQVKPDLIIVENLFSLPFIMTMNYKWAFIISTNPLKAANQIDYPPASSGVDEDFQWFVETYKEYSPNFLNQLNEWYKQCGIIDHKPFLSYIEPSPYFNVCLYPKMLNYFDPEIVLEKKWIQLSSTIVKDEVNKFIKDQGWITEQVAGKDEFLTDEFLNKPGKLILFSMGTLVSHNIEIFDKIMPVIAGCPHKFIISKGKKGDDWKLPNNSVGANNINQLEFLSRVDLFISHGGNNSFTEAFHFGVPMIIIPLMGDQHDNAARLERFKLGKRIYIQDITTENLCKAIDYLTETKTIKQKLKEISEIVQKDDSMDKLCDLVVETCSK